jgi:NADH-quinone oxidoreductase subunit E
MTQEITEVDEIIGKYGGDGSTLIQVLLEIQSKNRWLPKDTLNRLSQRLNVPLTQVYHIATFYKAFSLMPKGRHSVSVCQVRGAPRLLDRVIEALKIKPGETSEDMQFSLDTVNCLGCCALGPVMVVDSEYYSKPTTQVLEQVLTAKQIEP